MSIAEKIMECMEKLINNGYDFEYSPNCSYNVDVVENVHVVNGTVYATVRFASYDDCDDADEQMKSYEVRFQAKLLNNGNMSNVQIIEVLDGIIL